MSNISLAVELMTPLSLVDELDGDGEGAGEGVLAAEEPLLDDEKGFRHRQHQLRIGAVDSKKV